MDAAFTKVLNAVAWDWSQLSGIFVVWHFLQSTLVGCGQHARFGWFRGGDEFRLRAASYPRPAAPAIRNDPDRYHASPACYSIEKRDSW
jgi:hypothetical protein